MKHLESKANGLNIQDINPKNGSKFSPNLYKFLSRKTNSVTAMLATAWEDGNGEIWIGWYDDGGCFIGNRIYQVMCDPKAQSFAYGGQLGKMTEIPKFWRDYINVGRCAIDAKHEQYFLGSKRWSVAAKTRKCLWCGNCTQNQETRLVITKKKIWRTLK